MTLFFPQFNFTIPCSGKILVGDYLFSLSTGLLDLIGIAHFYLGRPIYVPSQLSLYPIFLVSPYVAVYVRSNN